MIVKNKYITVKHSSGEIHISEYVENARIETLQEIHTYDETSNIPASDVLPMPEEGERVEEHKLYSLNGKVYQAIQTHDRTHFTPEETPNLFAVKREDTGDLEWIENEKVSIGGKRWYNSVQYKCIQPHMTYEGYEPDKTPNLWNKVHTEEIIEWYQPTGAHDAFRLGDLVRYTDNNVYESLIDYNTYSPEAYPTGWDLRDDLS